jgi:hypothetical protein
MNANNPAMLIQSVDVRALSDAESVDVRALPDAELDGVGGGFLPFLVAALWAIDAGVLAGMAYCSITR